MKLDAPPQGTEDTIGGDTHTSITGILKGSGGVIAAAVANVDYAALASPVFTGDPRAPTASVDDNDTSIATTAFVVGQAASVAPLAQTESATVGTSLRYARQDHVHGPSPGGINRRAGLAASLTLTSVTAAWHDACSADWTARYATVSGTALAFDTNHYHLTANTDSTYRFRSYKWATATGCIVKITLPVCAEGDYVYVKFAANRGSLADGYGVGVIRQSTDTWQICTVKDSTMTVTGTTVTNLNDGDALYIKWDKTATGYTYYVYESAESCPAGTSVADTAYTWGYIGFVVHSASGSKEFVLNDVSMPNAGIVGYLNDGSTTVSRGSRIGKYWNGSAWVSCLAFSDDLNYDTIAEYTQVYRTWSIDTAAVELGCATDGGSLKINTPPLGSGMYRNWVRWKSIAASDHHGLLFGWGGALSGSNIPASTYYVDWRGNTGAVAIIYIDASGGQTTVGTPITYTPTVNAKYCMEAIWNASTGAITVNIRDVNNVVVATLSGTNTALTSGYSGMYQLAAHSDTVVVTGIEINAVCTQTTNGVAVCPASVPHGGAFDSQSEVYYTLTNRAKYGTYKLIATATTSNAAADDVQLYYANTTDSTYIDSGDSKNTTDLTVTAAFTDFLEDLLVRYRDRGDTLKVAVRRKNYSGVSYDNQAAVWVDMLAIAPVAEV